MNWRECKDEKEKYGLYLASREWSLLKARVKERSHGICERCKANPSRQVHHLTYARKYREELEDLQDLCVGCHEFIHAHSGKDPIDAIPPMLGDKVIKSVYLAGKVTGTDWRDAFFDCEGKWSGENHSSAQPDNGLDWGIARGAIKTPTGKRLDFVGPWWKSLGGGGHGWVGHDSDGKHQFANKVTHDESRTDPYELMGNIILSLNSPGLLVFAWIDTPDCYGTLIEIGRCAGSLYRNPVIALAMPPTFDPKHDFWMAQYTAHINLRAETPIEAWRKLWNGEVERRASELSLPLEENETAECSPS